jgi:hypothetical protein
MSKDALDIGFHEVIPDIEQTAGFSCANSQAKQSPKQFEPGPGGETRLANPANGAVYHAIGGRSAIVTGTDVAPGDLTHQIFIGLWVFA